MHVMQELPFLVLADIVINIEVDMNESINNILTYVCPKCLRYLSIKLDGY